MIDLHTHIIPFVDDGAADYETSLKMLEIAVAEGITHMIATPHFINGSVYNYRQLVVEKLDELSCRAVSAGIDIKLLPGNEVYIDHELPEMVQKKQICTLNDSMYVLIELPSSDMPLYTDEVLFQLKLRGYTPIITHPERNSEISKQPDILISFIGKGTLCQINATSLTGLYGDKVRQTALLLLRHGMVHFVASDAHTCRGRAPRLKEAFLIVEAEMGSETAEKLFVKNGMAVIRNAHIYIPEPVKVGNRKSYFISFLSGQTGASKNLRRKT
ncbi:MAG: CpsB/CapC family capsule biosynthesis tyrosine phosphatase [Clostridiales bacterium]|nr:CpsB/CapC family capsule biosynthesis tyrosine phosphatase [Clostridiales bacterium]